eukprot:Seg2189.8 transcript_id=Seg2189.8/GoldUCD/mRNA.D3Y31 product="Potassium voltage-gated channel protein Shaker" protein_id=Seg2189.8/GoldUCD/D3Y31
MLVTRALDVDSNSSRAGGRPPISRRGTQNSDYYCTDLRNDSIEENGDIIPMAYKERIRFNVSGMMFETFAKTLQRFPLTLLGSEELRERYYDEETNVYFFDRNREAFESILFFYQSYGKLIKPSNLGIKLFIEELKFFKMGEEIINRFIAKVRYSQDEKKLNYSTETVCGKIWDFFENPKSKPAVAVTFFSMAVICLSVFIFCMETIPQFATKKYKKVFFRLEAFCVAWFTLELLLRFIACPEKFKFIKSPLNIIDLVSILPFYTTLIASMIHQSSEAPPLEFLRVIRLARVMRIFKLSRHLRIFKILGLTIMSSFSDLILLGFFVLIAVVLFASAIYYADNNTFKSIPDAFWYAIITLTNVGYGDSVPVTYLGKFIGSLCATCGLIVLALPLPIIVSSFMYFYNMEKENQKLEEQEKDHKRRISLLSGEGKKDKKWFNKNYSSVKVSPSQSQIDEISCNEIPSDMTSREVTPRTTESIEATPRGTESLIL